MAAQVIRVCISASLTAAKRDETASLTEFFQYLPSVIGSTSVSKTVCISSNLMGGAISIASLAQLVERCVERRRPRFDPSTKHQIHASVTQWTECLPSKQEVESSILSRRSK